MGKLHDQMNEDLLLKAYSQHPQRAYLRGARHFAAYYLRSPEEMGEQEGRGFLARLARSQVALGNENGYKSMPVDYVAFPSPAWVKEKCGGHCPPYPLLVAQASCLCRRR